MDEQELDVSLFSLVEEARKDWIFKQVWFLTPWGQWRRGSVQYVGEKGSLLVLVYKSGTPGIKVWSRVEKIPDVLKLVSREIVR